LTREPEPSTGLERRRETLPDVTAPDRAGAIVTEFVSSIVQEAQDRATAIIAEAQGDADAGRQAALDSAARIRQRVDDLARQLGSLLTDLRREADGLSAEPGLRNALEAPAVIEHQEVVVDAVEPEEPASLPAPEEHDAPPPEQPEQPELPAAPEDPEDIRGRLAQLSDEDLARTYSNAVRAAARQGGDQDHAARLRSVAEGAVEEALRRPAFTHEQPEPAGGLGRRALARRRRRHAIVLRELREACQRAQQQVAAESPGG